VGIWKRLKQKRAERRAEREAIEHNREEALRVGGDEQSKSIRAPFDEGFLSGLKR
jgi:hypothetical protein